MSDCSIEPNCDNNKKCKKNYYAKAYVLPQEYENLFPINIALEKGTIFIDLYNVSYKTKKYNK